MKILLYTGVGILILFIIFSLFKRKEKNTNTITVVRDTVWRKVDSVVYRNKITLVGTDNSYIPKEDKYIPTDNYDTLLVRFNSLVRENTSRNFYRDSLKLDSIGWLVVTDTVQFNKLQKRSYKYSYEIPTIRETKTITNYAKPKSQVYIGGGLDLTSVNIGFLYKTKKDFMFGAYVSPPLQNNVPQNQIRYGVQAYWKIRLKK